MLKKARSILIVGVGTSSAVVIDAYNKFFRIGLPVKAVTDSHLMLMHACLLERSNVVLGYSHSGSTRDPVETFQAAKERGAKCIAVTHNERSPLAKEAEVVLTTASRETRFRSEALASRVAQMTITDVLFTALSLDDLRKTEKLKKRIEEKIVTKQY